MGERKPQAVPAAVRMANEILTELAPGLAAERVAELRRKLPAYALRLEKSGQEVTADALRRAVVDLRDEFARAAGDGAGGGKMTLADYPALRAELMIERNNPWIKVFAEGGPDEYMALRRQGADKPYNRETWDFMMRALAARPDPLPLLDLLLTDNFNLNILSEDLPHHPWRILMGHIDRVPQYPFVQTYIRENSHFHVSIARQGRIDVIQALFVPENLAVNMSLMERLLGGAIEGRQREAIDYLLGVCPAAGARVDVLSKLASAGYTEDLLRGLQKRRETNPQEDDGGGLQRAILSCALQGGQVDTALALEPDKYVLRSLLMRNDILARMANAGDAAGLERLYGAGLWVEGPPVELQKLLQIAFYGKHKDAVAFLQRVERETCGSSASLAPDEGMEETAAWQIDELRRAVTGGASPAVIAYLGALAVGLYRPAHYYYHDQPVHEPAPRNEAEAVINRYREERAAASGSTLGVFAAQLRQRCQNGDKAGIMNVVRQIKMFTDAVEEIIAQAPPGTGRDVMQTLYERTDVLRGPEQLRDILTTPALEIEDLRELMACLPSMQPRSADLQAVIRHFVERGNWLLLAQLNKAGILDYVPEARDALLANTRHAAYMRGALAWARILPGAVTVPVVLMLQPLHGVRPDVLRSVMDLPEISKQGAAGIQAAFVLCAVLRSEDRIMRYVERWGSMAQRGYDPLMMLAQKIALPEKAPAIDLAAWGDALLQYGPEMGALIRYADRIPAPTGTLNEMRAEIARFHYARGQENPALSAFCFKRNISEEAHDQALMLLAQKRALPQARVQRIPDMHIDGAEFGMPGARFYRMKDDDFRGLFLGLLVDCCQHIAGGAAWCARHGFQSENGGFYVIETAEGEILGETWAWRGTGGQMVFDSLETLGKSSTENCRVSKEQWSALMDRVKERLEAEPGDITALLVGTDGMRCPLLNYEVRNAPPVPYAKAAAPAKPLDHKGYADSKEQYLFWAAPDYRDEPVPAPEGQEIRAWDPPGAVPQAAPQAAMAVAPHPPGAWQHPVRGFRHGPQEMMGFPDPRQIWADDGGPDHMPFPRRIRRGPGLLP